MSGQVFRAGTRTSRLALRQVDEAIAALKGFYPHIEFKIIGRETAGDKDKATPISDIEGSDFFTREIEWALLRKEIDFAVHSAKDLPNEIPEGLTVAAITKSIDPFDALVSNGNLKLDELKPGAKVGASSLRRKTQLKNYRADFQVVDIRGDIEERLKKLEEDGLDALVVAACALIRLGLEGRIAQRIPCGILAPHPLQGALALEVREDNKELIDILRVLDER